eukprot:c14550_g2_i1 orf=954-1937(+)
MRGKSGASTGLAKSGPTEEYMHPYGAQRSRQIAEDCYPHTRSGKIEDYRSFAFDLGDVEVACGSGTGAELPWKLEDVMAKAGEEADQHFVELTLDVRDDSVLLRNVQATSDDPECKMLVQEWERKGGSSLMNLVRSASNVSGRLLKQISTDLSVDMLKRTASTSQTMSKFSQELKRFANTGGGNSSNLGFPISGAGSRVPSSLRLGSSSRSQRAFLQRCKSSAEFALEGLRFISKTTGDSAIQWQAVENRFYSLASTDNLLARADFGFCIGMKDSNEFATELFDALARRRGLVLQAISLEELKDFWMQINNQSFDSRLQIFFDMCDK